VPLLLGIVLLALGVSLAVVWWSAAFVAALQVLCVTGLLLFGVVLSLVGYSSLKAQREFREALTEPQAAPTAKNSDTRIMAPSNEP
jgi:hypothetical protein